MLNTQTKKCPFLIPQYQLKEVLLIIQESGDSGTRSGKSEGNYNFFKDDSCNTVEEES
jgi:hypothetical protein